MQQPMRAARLSKRTSRGRQRIPQRRIKTKRKKNIRAHTATRAITKIKRVTTLPSDALRPNEQQHQSTYSNVGKHLDTDWKKLNAYPKSAFDAHSVRALHVVEVGCLSLTGGNDHLWAQDVSSIAVNEKRRCALSP